VTENVQVSLITGLCAAIPTTLAILVAAKSQGKKLDTQTKLAESSAVATEEVKQTLATNTAATTDKLQTLTVQGDAIHTLVNSNMGAQLKVAAVALRRIATMTKDPGDVGIALEAERLFADHVAKQAVVDSKTPPPAPAGP